MRNIIISTLLAITVLCYTPFISFAREDNVVIQIDLSNYDTFDETICITYQNKDGISQEIKLSLTNDYEQSLSLPPGNYTFTAKVENDKLGLIELSPYEFDVVASDHEFQTIVLRATDSAGLMAGNNQEAHKWIDSNDLNAQKQSEEVIEPYQYRVSNEENTGFLIITGPDVAGARELTYQLIDQNGKVSSYELKKENGFAAMIELSAGKYTEIEKTTVTAEEEISLPDDAEFYIDYYQYPLQTYYIQAGGTSRQPGRMQLWVKRKNSASYQVKNLYKFVGDDIIGTTVRENYGHEELPEKPKEISPALKEIETEILSIQECEREQEQDQKQKEYDNTRRETKVTIAAFIAGVILFIILLFWRQKNDQRS